MLPDIGSLLQPSREASYPRKVKMLHTVPHLLGAWLKCSWTTSKEALDLGSYMQAIDALSSHRKRGREAEFFEQEQAEHWTKQARLGRLLGALYFSRGKVAYSGASPQLQLSSHRAFLNLNQERLIYPLRILEFKSTGLSD
jgi:hypothetical protein